MAILDYKEGREDSEFNPPISLMCDYLKKSGLEVKLDKSQMKHLSDVIRGEILHSSDADIRDIRSYLADTYCRMFLNPGFNFKALSDFYKEEVKTRSETLVLETPKIIQNGVELGKMFKLCQLENEVFEDLIQDFPVEVVRSRGNYLINGNNRLLQAKLRGMEDIPSTVYYITDTDFRRSMETVMARQSEYIKNVYKTNNVRALELDFLNTFNEFVKSQFGETSLYRDSF